MDTIEQVFHFVNNRQHITSEEIAHATGLDLYQVIKDLVILSGDKLVKTRFIGLNIVYDGKDMDLPAIYCTPATKEPEQSTLKPMHWTEFYAR